MTPSSLGLPVKFGEFRDVQMEAIEHGLRCFNDGYRFAPEGLPVGCGKSLVAMGLAKTLDVRTVILTATKGLMTQYHNEFAESGLVQIKGKANYRCQRFPKLSCHIGALEGCPLVDGEGCTYECERDVAREASTVVTNYSYWFHVNERQPALGDVQLLVLDECHQAFNELAKYLQVEIRETWLRRAQIQAPENTIEAWAKLAFNNLTRLSDLTKEAARDLRANPSSHTHTILFELDSLKKAFGDLMTMLPEYWVLDSSKIGTSHGRTWIFDSIWPAAYAVRLFQAAPRVLPMSGTLRPSTMGMLGVKKENYQFREWPRVFPPQNTPVYHIPTVWVNKDISEEDLDLWVKRIDEIIDTRLDRKGLIHTVSYDRQDYLYLHSRHRGHMDINKADSDAQAASQVFERFKLADPPRILVSPSFSTGWDFPGQECEYIIIAKVPFPKTNSPVVMARNARNPLYSDTVALQDLIQSAYRGTRFFSDRCEVFIIDNCYWRLIKNVPNAKPMWFSSIQRNTVPPPGPRAPQK